MRKKKTTDRHLHSKMTIRLGPQAEALLKQAKDAEDRTYTAIIIRALKLYAKENGYTWPKDSKTPGES